MIKKTITRLWLSSFKFCLTFLSEVQKAKETFWHSRGGCMLVGPAQYNPELVCWLFYIICRRNSWNDKSHMSVVMVVVVAGIVYRMGNKQNFPKYAAYYKAEKSLFFLKKNAAFLKGSHCCMKFRASNSILRGVLQRFFSSAALWLSCLLSLKCILMP